MVVQLLQNLPYSMSMIAKEKEHRSTSKTRSTRKVGIYNRHHLNY